MKKTQPTIYAIIFGRSVNSKNFKPVKNYINALMQAAHDTKDYETIYKLEVAIKLN